MTKTEKLKQLLRKRHALEVAIEKLRLEAMPLYEELQQVKREIHHVRDRLIQEDG